MLDRDLAAMYGVETKVLNQAVKRNIKRFEGDDFMFRLTKDEATHVALRAQNVTLETPLYTGDSQNLTRLRSQNVTSNIGRGGARYLPPRPKPRRRIGFIQDDSEPQSSKE